MKRLFAAGLLFLLLEGGVVLGTGEFTLRHALFPLISALLSVFGDSLQERKREFRIYIFALVLVAFSLFIAHLAAPAPMRVWEADTLIAFFFSAANLAAIFVSLPMSRPAKLSASLAAALLFTVPVASAWTATVAEGAWPNTDAVVAVMQSNPSEAKSYIADALGEKAIALFAVFILAAALLSFLGTRLRRREGSRAAFAAMALLAVLSGVLLWRTRENVLTIPVLETRGYISRVDEFRAARSKREARVRSVASGEAGRDGLFVLVIGESETRDHMGAFGYGRDTTPWMNGLRGREGFALFNNAYACYVQTVKALAYALTAANQYGGPPLSSAPSIIEVADAAGYDTAWLSNQIKLGLHDTPTSVMADEAKETVWLNSHIGEGTITDVYDEALADALARLAPAKKRLVVIHLMGSHNSYQDRFPKEFARFSGKGGQVDDYDGSVLYTDRVLEKIYDAAKNAPGFQAMVYFSDHGEGVDYGHRHNAANFSWPMARVPLFIALSEDFVKNRPDIYENLKRHEKSPFTNDLVFDLMLGLMDLRPERFYDEKNDLSSAGYDARPERFLTLYGEKHITEDDNGN